MKISDTHHDFVTVVVIQGSVDSLTAEELTGHLTQHVRDGRIRLVADFSGVDYTSSAGLRSILIAVKDSRRQGGDLRLAAMQPSVERVLSLSGFTNILKIFGSVEMAISSFEGA